QERASTQGGVVQPSFASVPVSQTPVLEEMPSVSPNQGMPTLASQSSLDTLLSRCPQSQWSPDLTSMLFMNGNDSARGTEEYRTLRSRLYHLREKMNLKTLLVTSALPKEGKSFTAANLAQVMVRQQGRRALLVDADLRGPRLHQMLGTAPGPG